MLHTVEALLARAALPPLEARLLLAHVLGRDRAWLAAHGDTRVAAPDEHAYLACCARRASGEPIAYIVEGREFYGLRLRITPAVLIPRPETELLVDLALARIAAHEPARVLDLGTGSGAVALAVAAERPRAVVMASDLSRDALTLALENGRALGIANVSFVVSDWYAQLAGGEFDFIVSNPPYVAEGDQHLTQGDLRFEPRAALVAGESGLAALRVIVEGAQRHLASGGWLLVEHGYEQAAACVELFGRSRFMEVGTAHDLAGLPRVTFGRRAT
jgi:release factor glutamine methyltransferase